MCQYETNVYIRGKTLVERQMGITIFDFKKFYYWAVKIVLNNWKIDCFWKYLFFKMIFALFGSKLTKTALVKFTIRMRDSIMTHADRHRYHECRWRYKILHITVKTLLLFRCRIKVEFWTHIRANLNILISALEFNMLKWTESRSYSFDDMLSKYGSRAL